MVDRGDKRTHSHLLQRLSVAVQRGNGSTHTGSGYFPWHLVYCIEFQSFIFIHFVLTIISILLRTLNHKECFYIAKICDLT